MISIVDPIQINIYRRKLQCCRSIWKKGTYLL